MREGFVSRESQKFGGRLRHYCETCVVCEVIASTTVTVGTLMFCCISTLEMLEETEPNFFVLPESGLIKSPPKLITIGAVSQIITVGRQYDNIRVYPIQNLLFVVFIAHTNSRNHQSQPDS